MGARHRSPLHGGQWLSALLGGCGDAWRGLERQSESELAEQHFLLGVGFGVAAEDQSSAVGGREVDVEHLDGGESVEHGAGREAGGQGPEPGAKRDVQAISQEGDEDVSLDALLQLVVDRPQLQVVLQIFEGASTSTS